MTQVSIDPPEMSGKARDTIWDLSLFDTAIVDTFVDIAMLSVSFDFQGKEDIIDTISGWICGCKANELQLHFRAARRCQNCALLQRLNSWITVFLNSLEPLCNWGSGISRKGLVLKSSLFCIMVTRYATLLKQTYCYTLLKRNKILRADPLAGVTFFISCFLIADLGFYILTQITIFIRFTFSLNTVTWAVCHFV